MKKFVLALTALSAFAAAPAMARSDTHISVGFYSPAPAYYAPPVVYYPPVNHVYYAPRRAYCPPRYSYVRHDRGYRGHGRDYAGAHYVNHRSDWNR